MALLDLQVICMLNLIFSVVIGSVIVKNIYIYTKIVTLGAFLKKLEPFFYIFHRLGGHFGDHLGFTGRLHNKSQFLLLHWVGHSQKHIPRHQNYDSSCIVSVVRPVFLHIPYVRQPFWQPTWRPSWIYRSPAY